MKWKINPAWIEADPKKTGVHLVMLGLPSEPYTREQLEAGPQPKTKAEKEFVRQWGYLPTWRNVNSIKCPD